MRGAYPFLALISCIRTKGSEMPASTTAENQSLASPLETVFAEEGDGTDEKTVMCMQAL